MNRQGGARAVAAVLGFVVALAAGPALAQPSPSPASAPPAGPAIGAQAAILANVRTGRVLYERNAHVPLPVASLTKVMTALVARDKYRLDEVVVVTDVVNTVRGSKLGLKPGMQMTVADLLNAMLILSANDAAVVLAAHDALGVPGFLAAMNEKAKALGARSSSFANPHGLDADGHLSTAWDMAMLARALLRDPALAEIVARKTYALAWPEGGQRVIRNHNKLVGTSPGVFGVKTGYTNQAGRCLIAAASLDVTTPSGAVERRDALTVVLNAGDHYADTKSLFSYFQTDPKPLGPTLQAPRPSARPVLPSVKTTPASVGGPAGFRWMAFPMAMLGAAMLLTVRPGRRATPLQEAAQFHPYLEPLAVAEGAVPDPILAPMRSAAPAPVGSPAGHV